MGWRMGKNQIAIIIEWMINEEDGGRVLVADYVDALEGQFEQLKRQLEPRGDRDIESIYS